METKRRFGAKHYDLGRIIDGDWDLHHEGNPNPVLSDGLTHQSVFMRYVEGRDWAETPQFAWGVDQIDQRGFTDHGISSRGELVERYRQLDAVFEDMRANGYRVGEFEDSISVSITRSGGFLLGEGGKHRLAMAKLLRLPTIEVYVLARHTIWQGVRERAIQHPPFTPHPDLEEFLPDRS